MFCVFTDSSICAIAVVVELLLCCLLSCCAFCIASMSSSGSTGLSRYCMLLNWNACMAYWLYAVMKMMGIACGAFLSDWKLSPSPSCISLSMRSICVLFARILFTSWLLAHTATILCLFCRMFWSRCALLCSSSMMSMFMGMDGLINQWNSDAVVCVVLLDGDFF